MENNLDTLLSFLRAGAVVGGYIGAGAGGAGGLVIAGFIRLDEGSMGNYWVRVLRDAGMDDYLARVAWIFFSVAASGVFYGACLGLFFWLLWVIGKR